MPRKLIDNLEIEYERFLDYTVTSITALRISRVLCDFLECFPLYREPADFGRKDVEDYKAKLLAEGKTLPAIQLSLGYIRAFWNWMRDHKEMSVSNPAKNVLQIEIPELPLQTLYNLEENSVIRELLFGGTEKEIARRTGIASPLLRAKLRRIYVACGVRGLRELREQLRRLKLRLGAECLTWVLARPQELQAPPSENQVPSPLVSTHPVPVPGTSDSDPGPSLRPMSFAGLRDSKDGA